jgi:hypothetical protein
MNKKCNNSNETLFMAGVGACQQKLKNLKKKLEEQNHKHT